MKKILCFILPLFLGFSGFSQSTFINEINLFTTPVQCVEIATPTGKNLSQWDLHRYESDGTTSGSLPVTGPVTTEAGFDFIIVDAVIFLESTDGLVLTDENGLVIQFLSFGAQITATDGPASGFISDNIGVQTLATHSLQLTSSGNWTTDNFGTCGFANLDQAGSISGNLTLPVELLYFKANERSKKVYLEWETQSEFNNNYFLLEKSKDGIRWSDLAEIPGKTNSNERMIYEHLDKYPHAGNNYYRLSQLDADGKMEIFDIITLQVGSSNDVELFPNPGSDIIHIKLSGTDSYDDVKIMVHNIFGKLVIEDTLSRGILNVSHLESGIYSIQINIGNKQYQMLFTKI